MEIRSTSCCGLDEMQGISDESNSTEIMKRIKRNYQTDISNFGEPEKMRVEKDELPTFLLFTEVTREHYGKELEEYILKEKLGEISKTKSKINSNSDNKITAYIWTLNKRNLIKKLNSIKLEE